MIKIKELKKLTQNLSVLYVEDDLAIQKTMDRYLRKLFEKVVLADNGLEGLEIYDKGLFDIVITDLSMPKMNGLDMIVKIKEIDESQVILVTTAHSEPHYTVGAMKAHIDGYILKPFDYNELNFELFKITEKIQKFQENEEFKKHLQSLLKKQTQEMRDNYEKTLYSMIELIEQRDTYTAGHSKRVAKYSKLIAQKMGYSEEDCTLLYQAGIMHDVGKIETPDAVLLNPKKLSEIEYKLIQEHVEVGYKLLKNIPMFESLASIVHAHHERYDGKGYPNGLKGEEIGKLARIMIVADAFDAMTTNRIYKARKSVQEACSEILKLSEKQFHPEVVQSAVDALKNIDIDESINQLPNTRLEQERFAYFYKDTLSAAYNKNYLEIVLMKNNLQTQYKDMVIFSLADFSSFNKENGWEKGDAVLKEFANTLCTHFNEDLVFRVFGDDFIVMCKEIIETRGVRKVLDEFMRKNSLSYRFQNIDLQSQIIHTLEDIEVLQVN